MRAYIYVGATGYDAPQWEAVVNDIAPEVNFSVSMPAGSYGVYMAVDAYDGSEFFDNGLFQNVVLELQGMHRITMWPICSHDAKFSVSSWKNYLNVR